MSVPPSVEAPVVRIEPFEQHWRRYEEWFERHPAVFQSELEAVRVLLPHGDRRVEVGVGSGRFAHGLGIRYGVEPSGAMRRLARARGIRVVAGVAEQLPLRSTAFSAVLMVTTICFVDDPVAALGEARRVLQPDGALVVGIVDRESSLGRFYERHREENPFYRAASFYSTPELLGLMRDAGFGEFRTVQTLFGALDGIQRPQPAEDGYGRGAFVVIRA